MDGLQLEITKPKRAPVSDRVRFEVFKRDKFTCQYCGRSSPEVVLNCDHVVSVKDGGRSDILNLITSCRPCNGGKGAVALGDDSAVRRQKAMLDELEDRRQQLEMMVRWRDELRTYDADVVDVISTLIGRISGGIIPNEDGRKSLRRLIRKYSIEEIITATEESYEIYLEYVDDEPTKESWERAFARIPAVLNTLREEVNRPHLRRLLYIQGIIRKRIRHKWYDCIGYLEHLVRYGADVDDMEHRAKRIRGIDDFDKPYDEWLEKIGKPY